MPRTPIHPGEILRDELDAIGMTAAALARTIRVPAARVRNVLTGRSPVTADLALRIGHWQGTGPETWLNLQSLYELDCVRGKLKAELSRIPRRAAAA